MTLSMMMMIIALYNSGFLQAQILFYLVLRIGYDAT